MYIHLKIIGVLLIVLAFLHIGFSKYFNWKEELSSLSLINQQMMKVHTFFIAFVVFLIGVLCFTSTKEIIETNLGRKIAFGLSLFESLWYGQECVVSEKMNASVLIKKFDLGHVTKNTPNSLSKKIDLASKFKKNTPKKRAELFSYLSQKSFIERLYKLL